MSFRNRLLLGMALMVAAFLATVIVANSGLRSTSARFGEYLDGAGTLRQAYGDMYAQGLQMGQALRNIVLDPANPKAYENLEKARRDFSLARDTAASAARRVEGFDQAVSRLAPLAMAQADAQGEVLAALKRGAPDDAKALINKKETPAWRALKQALLDDMQAIGEQADRQRQSVEAQSRQAQNIGWVLTGFALLFAAGSVIGTLRYVRRELGGEPAYARQVAHAVAEGNLGLAVTVAADDRDSLLAALAVMRNQLRELVGTLATLARRLGTAAHEVNAVVSLVVQGSDRQMQQAEAMVGHVSHLATSLQLVMREVAQAQEIVETSGQLSDAGAALASRAAAETESMAGSVRDTAAHIQELGNQSAQINSILSVISEIANQTNLLALNAAIEAARAGEQGRGFAVVADEVRKLAERTSQSTAEISTMVDNIRNGTSRAVAGMESGLSQVASSVELSDQSREAFDRMRVSSDQVIHVVHQIAAAINAESHQEEAIQAAVEKVSMLIAENNRALQQAAAATAELDQTAATLNQAIARFQL